MYAYHMPSVLTPKEIEAIRSAESKGLNLDYAAVERALLKQAVQRSRRIPAYQGFARGYTGYVRDLASQ